MTCEGCGGPVHVVSSREGTSFYIPAQEQMLGDCWIWPKCKTKLGYGQKRHNGKTSYAHRILFEILRGGLAREMSLDHLCRNPSCVNPWHLDQVSQRENVYRGYGPSAINKRKIKCARGHFYSHKTTINKSGHRVCGKCTTANNAMLMVQYYKKKNDTENVSKFKNIFNKFSTPDIAADYLCKKACSLCGRSKRP